MGTDADRWRQRTLVVGATLVVAAVAIAVAVLTLNGSGGAAQEQDPARPELSGGFRFESPQLNEGPLPVRMVSYSTDPGRASGLLTVPPGDRDPMPAVIYLHGLGASSSDFITEAVFMGAKGTVTLAVDAADVSAGDPPLRGVEGLRADLALREATVQRIAAAIELLRRHPDVDESRIALVGFSRGGAVAALAASRAESLAAEVYISAGAGLDTWPGKVGALGSEERDEAAQIERRIDPIAALDENRSVRPRLVQHGVRDSVIPPASLRRFARAVPQPKRVETFRGGHPLNVRALYKRLEWLDVKLKVDGPPVAGAPRLDPANTGPTE